MTPKVDELYNFREGALMDVPDRARPVNGRSDEPGDEDEILQIRLRVDDYEDRLRGLSGKDYRMMERSPESQMKFLACFMVDEDGDYLGVEAGIEILDGLPYGDILEAYTELQEALQEAVVPKKSGKRSAKVRISKYR